MSDSTLEPATGPKMPPNAGKGRVKGVPNKITAEVKQMVIDALETAGGVEYLVKKAESHPAAFLTLVGKVIPLQVTGKLEHEHSGSVSSDVGSLVAELRSLGREGAVPASLPH